jgi:glycosyltransferase involved in cell wall biosynthesis
MMKNGPTKLVVMMPALNEDKTVGDVIRGVPDQIDGIDEIQIVVVDDGSTDGTVDEAEQAGAKVLSMGQHVGLGRVFRVGLDKALTEGADIVVNIDSDGQFDPADIPKLIEPILEGRADFVTCTRFANSARPDMPRIKYWGNRAVTGIVNWICGNHKADKKFSDVSCGFRAFSREAICRLTLFGSYTYTQETFIDLHSKSMRIAEVPLTVRGEREHGKSRIASSVLKYGVNSALIMLRAMRDTRPLKFFGGISAMLGVMGASCGLFLLTHYFINGHTSPYTSLVTITGVLVVLAFILLVLALLADMIGRHRRVAEESLYLQRIQIHQLRKQLAVEVSARSVKESTDRPLVSSGNILGD